jgi:hypothetical protein
MCTRAHLNYYLLEETVMGEDVRYFHGNAFENDIDDTFVALVTQAAPYLRPPAPAAPLASTLSPKTPVPVPTPAPVPVPVPLKIERIAPAPLGYVRAIVEPRRAPPLRDPLWALALVLALAYLAYLTYVGGRGGATSHREFVFALSRALARADARRAIFEFPLVRLAVARLGGALVARALLFVAPLAVVALLVVRAAGRAVAVGVCAAACLGVAAAALRASALLFAHDAVSLALLCVALAFVALIALYLVYVARAALLAFGAVLEDAARIVVAALPALLAATLLLGALYACAVAWLFVTLADHLTATVSSVVDGDGGSIFIGGSATAVYFCVLMLLWLTNLFGAVLRVGVARGALAWSRAESVNAGVARGIFLGATLSLGSLALAALLVALVELVYVALERTRALFKHLGLSLVARVLKIVLLLVRSLLKTVNSFVYVEIAFFNISFWEAGARVGARLGKTCVQVGGVAYVLVALRAGVAALAVALAAHTLGEWRGALAAFAVCYCAAALPAAWLESAAHARLVLDADAADHASPVSQC